MGGQREAFEDAVGIGLEHEAIHEGAGVAFVAVADDVLLAGAGLEAGERPFAAGGEARAAAAAEAGGDDLFDERAGLHEECGAERLVAAAGEVVVDGERIDHAAVFEHDALAACRGRRRRRRRVEQMGGRSEGAEAAGVAAGDVAGGLGGDVAVESDGAAGVEHLDDGLAVAHAVAAD